MGKSNLSPVITTAERVLPARDEDPVARLDAHYFFSADLMLKNRRMSNVKQYRSPERIRQNDREWLAYTRLWLSLLYVTCKEFEKELETQIVKRPEHFVTLGDLWTKQQDVRTHFHQKRSMLADFRNSQFHFDKNTEKQLRFFKDDQAMNWAEELHKRVARFFSAYRVEAASGYMNSGRHWQTGV